MHQKVLFLLFLLLSYQLKAQKTKLQIAHNAVGKLRISLDKKDNIKNQLKLIGEGILAIESAEKDKKTKNLALTWAIKSYLSSCEAILDSNNTEKANKYYHVAIKALEKAGQLDTYQKNTTLINAANYNIKIKNLEYAKDSFLQNDFSKAFDFYKDVSDFFPKDTSLAINTALSALNLEKTNDAIVYFKKAQENGLKNPAVYQQLANLYESELQDSLAISTLEDGLDHNPNHLMLHYTYINALLNNQKYKKAAKAIGQVTVTDIKNKLLYFLLGYIQQEKFNNYSSAKSSYKKGLAIDPNYFKALYQLGLLHINDANQALAKNDNEKFVSEINLSESMLLKAYHSNPNDSNTIKLLIEIYTRKNNLNQVQKLKRKLNEF